MSRSKVAALFSGACIVLLAVSGCGTNDAGSEPPTTTQSATTSETIPHMPPVAEPIELKKGMSTEAAEATAERFLVGWTTFVPWDFDPAGAWFDRWEHLAAPAFRGRMQLSVNDMWSWSWNQRKKAFDARIEGTPTTWIAEDRAITRMTINRLIMRIDARVNEVEEQRQTFDVSMDLDPTSAPVVIEVQPTHPGAPAPDMGR